MSTKKEKIDKLFIDINNTEEALKMLKTELTAAGKKYTHLVKKSRLSLNKKVSARTRKAEKIFLSLEKRYLAGSKHLEMLICSDPSIYKPIKTA